MFEHPEIIDLGDTREIVLGIASIGLDIDGSFTIPDSTNPEPQWPQSGY
jgi:hypothetical protein